METEHFVIILRTIVQYKVGICHGCPVSEQYQEVAWSRPKAPGTQKLTPINLILIVKSPLVIG